MAKATALSADLMATSESTQTTLSPRPAVKAATKTDKPTPLQIRIPASEAKAIKRAALDADQTVSDYMLACFHAYKNK